MHNTAIFKILNLSIYTPEADEKNDLEGQLFCLQRLICWLGTINAF